MSTISVRLSVDMNPKDHKKLKIIADAYGFTLREFVLNLLDPILHPEKKPNKVTKNIMKDAEKGINLIKYKNIDDFLDKMGITD